MKETKMHVNVARGFFLVSATLVFIIFWKIIEPFALTLLTAGIAAVALGPLDRELRRHVKWPRLAALIMTVGTFLVIGIPLFLVGVGIFNEASQIVRSSIGNTAWLASLDPHQNLWVARLPETIREQVYALDPVTIGRGAANWVLQNVGGIFTSTVAFVFLNVFFYAALYYMLADRDALRQEILALSPFKNKLDENILVRMSNTVRAVVFSAIVVSVIKGILATIGMAILGVPGALLWGAVTVVASQIPIFGVGLVLLPAAAYLFLTGHPMSAIAMVIWSTAVVGLVDNILSPFILQGRTNMHPLLILISILGGIQLFGPIGFVVGPVVLAAVMVVLELYKSGILEKGA